MGLMPRLSHEAAPDVAPRRMGTPRLWNGRADDASLRSLLDDLTRRWQGGEHPQVEDYLDRVPPDATDARISLILQDFHLSESSGLHPDPDDYGRRFPEQRTQLTQLLRLHADNDLPSDDPDDDLPEDPLPLAGDEIGPYLLIRLLGHGSFARVFLAEQLDLESRPVVVKVTDRPTAEPRLLARAPHPNIVPILREAITDEGMQIICMPFHGGGTLEMLLELRRTSGRRPATGASLLDDLDEIGAGEFPPDQAAGTTRDLITRLSYSRTVAWWLARLAEGLDHAFRRGVTHGDLKPSNVLLAADGRPMLLDFNLSTDWREPVDDLLAGARGTLGYMAPERLRAVADPDSSALASVHASDRHRADIYSLGLILLEALTGSRPSMPRALPDDPAALAAKLARARADGRGGAAALGTRQVAVGSLASWPASVPAGLRPILARCLDPLPSRRYRSSRELAEDLDRWRKDLPLIHARPDWWSEPVRWARRRRRSLVVLSLALGLVAGAARLMTAAQDAREGAALELLSHWMDRLESALFQFRWPGRDASPDDVPRDAGLASELALTRYGALDEQDWRQRPDVRDLPDDDRDDLEAFLREQAFRLALSISRGELDRSPRERDRLSQGLRRFLDQHPDPTSTALLGDRPTAVASTLPPTLSWVEDYLRGIRAESLTRAEALHLGLDPASVSTARAFEAYTAAVSHHDRSFWANYRLGKVAYHLRRFRAAESAMARCCALREGNAAAHIGRSASLYYLGLADQAGDVGREAASLDPDSAVPYMNLVYLERDPERREEVLHDYQRRAGHPAHSLATTLRNSLLLPQIGLIASPAPMPAPADDLPSSVAELRYRLALSLAEQGQYGEAYDLWSLVLDDWPDHLPARFSRATVAQRLGRDAEAAADYALLVDDPNIDDLIALNKVAILAFCNATYDLLRKGKGPDALELAERGLDKAIEEGVLIGETHYAVARCHAVLGLRDSRQLDQAVLHLRAAAAESASFLTDRFLRDPMLDPVRADLLLLLGPDAP